MSLSDLIDTERLLQFGRGTIVPLAGTIGAVATAMGALSEGMGDLSELETTDKSSVVAAINEVAAGGGGAVPVDVEGRLSDCEQNILALALAFAMEQEAEAEGMSDNIVVEVFADNTGFILISGAYDSTNHRIYA